MAHIFQVTSLTAEELQSLIRISVKEAIHSWQIQNDVNKDVPEFGTRKEVALLLRVSLPTIDDYIKRGLIQAVRIGGRIRIKRSEIEKALIEIKSIRYQRR